MLKDLLYCISIKEDLKIEIEECRIKKITKKLIYTRIMWRDTIKKDHLEKINKDFRTHYIVTFDKTKIKDFKLRLLNHLKEINKNSISFYRVEIEKAESRIKDLNNLIKEEANE